MPSLKDLKNRIESVKSTRKITKAMQMVAAAKLRRAQESAEASRPYAERFNAVMAGLAASVGGSDSAPKLLRGTGSDDVHLLVVMTAERGLCGGFNANIAKLARAKADELRGKGKTVKVLTVGKKGRDFFRRKNYRRKQGHRQRFLQVLGSVDLNLYVTLSECLPLTPMESYLLGIPCLASRTSAVFRSDAELWDLSTVDELDNPRAIAAAARRLLGRSDEAIHRARIWMRRWDAEAAQLFDEFAH